MMERCLELVNKGTKLTALACWNERECSQGNDRFRWLILGRGILQTGAQPDE